MDSPVESNHRPLLLGLKLGTLLAFILTAAFNGLASSPGNGVFLRGTTNVSNTYLLEITPAGWTFSIWGLIYLWQAVWILYSLSLVVRKGPEGPLYLNPVLLSPVFFIIYLLNLGLNIGWLLLFDRELLDVSYAFLVAMFVTLYMCLGLSYKDLEKSKSALAKSGRKIDDILVRVFVHNGLGIYAAWTTIASFLNMAFVIAYRSDPVISVSTASSSALAGILVALVVYAGTDLTILDKYSRYTITPYCVVIWALGGSLSKNYDSGNTNTIFSLVLMAIAVVALVAKIIVVILRRNSKPVFSSSAVITKDNVNMT